MERRSASAAQLFPAAPGVEQRQGWVAAGEHALITCTPDVRSGKPCVAGTRITVSDVLEVLASGMSQDEILSDFPDLRPEHIQAVRHFGIESSKALNDC